MEIKKGSCHCGAVEFEFAGAADGTRTHDDGNHNPVRILQRIKRLVDFYYFKGLAETRARAAGDVERFQKILDEVSLRLAETKAKLAACDKLIVKLMLH